MRSNHQDTLEGDVRMTSLALTATIGTNGKVEILGDKSKQKVDHGNSPTFQFSLNDQTQLNVRFDSLDTEDTSKCPPSSGLNSSQIPQNHVVINDKSAHFKDVNTQEGDVCYQWVFKCDDGQQPTFDPIIDNRGGGFI
jgi:hypothetical protein